MAAESSVLVEKRRVEYRNLATRKWLNRCQSERVPFDWTINPYRGCEFACKYCYARYTHDFLERHDPTAFETEIYAKEFNTDGLSGRAQSRKARANHRYRYGYRSLPACRTPLPQHEERARSHVRSARRFHLPDH